MVANPCKQSPKKAYYSQISSRITSFAQFFWRFQKKYSNLIARIQIYIYICTKNVAPNGSYSV